MSLPRRVAVLGGGRSSEYEVSLRSAAAVAGGLEHAGHDVISIEIGRDGVWRRDGAELSLTPGRGLSGVDVVFPVLHGPFGEDGTVQGLLEVLGVPYVGAGVLASAVCMDKVRSKELLSRAGIPQVDYRAVTRSQLRAGAQDVLDALGSLGLPVFVKPARLGSSVGIARVALAGALEAALADAFEHDSLAIVEACATGIEVECSVIGNGDPFASEPGEIVLTDPSEGGWYDYAAKYDAGGMRLVVPARISEDAVQRVRDLAVEVFCLLGCTGLARVDFFVDGELVLVNELNTMPGFTETSVFGVLLGASGVPFADVVDRLVDLAIERHADESAYRH